MKIGVSTACYYPLETEKALDEVGKSGIDTTEIFFNANCELLPGFIKELVNIKEHYGTFVTSLHPAMSFADSFMIFSAYKRRLDEGLDTYRRYGEAAAVLGAKFVIMHGGKPNGVLNTEQYCERFAAAADAVGESGAVLLQENVVNFRAGNPEFIKEMKRMLGEKACFCLDLKQCIRGGYSPFNVIDAVGSSVKHIHLSDSLPENDCMLPLNGGFDFKAFLDYAHLGGFEGDCVIEVYQNAYHEYAEISESCRKLNRAVL